ncbi:SdpI/YhfL protein family protein [Curtobacterium sp. YR515]|nr:SdpI/YhfL protein family protein [Curtobacterium sp. YR515]
MLLSGLALTCSGVVVALVAELTARGVLRRNGGAGVRIASVMKTDATWKAGHRAARPWLHGTALSFGGSGILSIVAQPSIADPGFLVGMASGLLLLCGGAAVAHQAARRTEDATGGPAEQ